MIRLTVPAKPERLAALRAGERVLLSGVIYTLRDAGHKRLLDSIYKGRPDFDVNGAAIYYCGPAPEKPGEPIGSCGPTTSARMDDYTPALLERGLRVMIGKGKRSPAVIESMVKNGAVYLLAVGGAGALYKAAVIENRPALYADLGCEAMRALTVRDMELLVGIDAKGVSIV